MNKGHSQTLHSHKRSYINVIKPLTSGINISWSNKFYTFNTKQSHVITHRIAPLKRLLRGFELCHVYFLYLDMLKRLKSYFKTGSSN